jgi:hypothetical protein
MPVTNAQSQLIVRVGYDATQLVQGVAPSKDAIRGLVNEITTSRNELALGAISAEQYGDSLRATANRAIDFANNLDRSSDEYQELIGVAARARAENERVGQSFRVIETESTRARSGLDRIKTGLRSIADEARTSFASAQQSFFFLTSNIQTVGNAISGIFSAMNEGARSLEMQEAFESQVGGSEQAVARFLGTLDAAAGGTISDMNLMRSASKAMSLGVTQDADEMASLLEIARFKARKFGTDTATAFEDISVGVGRQSKLILDNLGIVVDIERAYDDYAAKLGITAGQLDDVQKKQAFLNSVLAAGQDEIAAAGGLVDSQADKLRIMQNEWDTAIIKAKEYLALVGGQIVTGGGGEGGETENQVVAVLENAQAWDLYGRALQAARGELVATEGVMAGQAAFIFQTAGNYQGLINTLALSTEAQRIFNVALLENAASSGVSQQAALAMTGATSAGTLAYYDQVAALYSHSAIMYESAAATGESNSQQNTGIGVAGVFGETMDFVGRVVGFAAGQIDAANAVLGTFIGTMDTAIGFAYGLADALGRVRAARAEAGGLAGQLDYAQTNLEFAQSQYANSSSLAGRIRGYAGVLEAQNDVASAEQRLVDERKRNAQQYINATLSERNAVASVGSAATASGRAATAGGRAATAAGRASSAAATTAARDHQKAAQDIQRSYEQEFSKIQGYVSQALSFNENVGERDALLDQFGLRNQNASDELIRQLADIRDRASEGTRSPWLDFFPELDAPTMAEIEARAESLMRSLKSGLRRDLLDPEAVKADVRERIAADRAAEEFNRQIAQQLVAEGAGSKAEIQNALASSLGVASVGAGEIASEQLVDTMAKGILESVEASASLFAQAGELMGDHIKSGLRTKFKDIAEELATMIIESVEEQA